MKTKEKGRFKDTGDLQLSPLFYQDAEAWPRSLSVPIP